MQCFPNAATSLLPIPEKDGTSKLLLNKINHQ
jgi:hypothetical protein